MVQNKQKELYDTKLLYFQILLLFQLCILFYKAVIGLAVKGTSI